MITTKQLSLCGSGVMRRKWTAVTLLRERRPAQAPLQRVRDSLRLTVCPALPRHCRLSPLCRRANAQMHQHASALLRCGRVTWACWFIMFLELCIKSG